MPHAAMPQPASIRPDAFYTPQQQRQAVAALLFINLINAVAFIMMKFGLDQLSPIYFIFFRYLSASIALFAVLRRKIFRVNRALMRDGVILGVVVSFGVCIQAIGLQYTTAGKASFITSLYVVIVAVIGWIYTRKVSRMQLITVAATTFGLAIFSLDENLQINKGDAITLVAAFSYSIHFILLGTFAKRHDILALTTWQVFFATVCSGVAALCLEPSPFPISGTIWLLVLFNGLIATAFSYCLQAWGQRIISPTQTSIIFSSYSIFTAFFDWLFLHQTFTLRQYLGAALLLACTLLVTLFPNLGTKKKQKQALAATTAATSDPPLPDLNEKTAL